MTIRSPIHALAAVALGLSVAPPAASAELKISGADGPRWSRSFASPGDDWINDLVPLANGNVLAVGFMGRDDDAPAADWAAFAAEISPSGRVHAERRYGEGGGTDAFWSVLEGARGRRMFAGFTTRIGAGGIDALALIAERDGRLVVEQPFGDAGYDRFTDLTQAGDGFVFVGHSQLAGSDRRRVFLVRTGPDGKESWRRIFEGPGSWGGLYVEPSGNGGFVIAGGVSESGAKADMFVIRTDGEGRELWRKRVGTPDWEDINHGLIVRPDGLIVLVGYGHPTGGEVNDLIAATLDRDGKLLRFERFGGSGDERARLPKLDGDGRIWIAGHSDSAGAGGSDALIVALDANGAFTDQAILIGGPGNDIGTAALPMPDGSIILSGYRDTPGSKEDSFVAAIVPKVRVEPSPAFRRTVVTPAR
jgi:hypothetical protein